MNDAKASGYPLIVVIGKHAVEPVPKFELIDNTRLFLQQTGKDTAKEENVQSLLTHSQLFDELNAICDLFKCN